MAGDIKGSKEDRTLRRKETEEGRVEAKEKECEKNKDKSKKLIPKNRYCIRRNKKPSGCLYCLNMCARVCVGVCFGVCVCVCVRA